VIPEPKKVSVGDLPPVDAPTVKKINFGSASQFGPRGRWGGGRAREVPPPPLPPFVPTLLTSDQDGFIII
jgi:hypothetical protein